MMHVRKDLRRAQGNAKMRKDYNKTGVLDVFGNLIFSLNIVLPIFAVMLAGAVMRRFGLLTGEFVKTGNKLVFYVALPASLFLAAYRADLSQVFDANFVLFAVIVTTVVFALAWVLAELFIKDKTVIGSFVQGAVRGNFAILGLPLLSNLAGEEGMAVGVLVVTFVVPLYSIYSILVLSARSTEPRKVSVPRLLKTVFTNCMIVGILLGTLLAFFRVPLPQLVVKPLDVVAQMTTPLSLLCLGGSIDWQAVGKKWKLAAASSFIKIVVTPLVCLPLAYFFGFRGSALLTLLVMLGVPTAIAGYAMAVQMKGDEAVAAACIVMTTLFSAFTLTGFIFAFRTLGLL